MLRLVTRYLNQPTNKVSMRNVVGLVLAFVLILPFVNAAPTIEDVRVYSYFLLEDSPLYQGYFAVAYSSGSFDYKTYRWFVNDVENFNTFSFFDSGDGLDTGEFNEGDEVVVEITHYADGDEISANGSVIVEAPFSAFVEGNWASQVYNESNLSLNINWSGSYSCQMFVDGSQIVDFESQNKFSPDLQGTIGTPSSFDIISEFGGTPANFLQSYSGNFSSYFDSDEHNLSIRCFSSPRAIYENDFTEYSGIVFLGNPIPVEPPSPIHWEFEQNTTSINAPYIELIADSAITYSSDAVLGDYSVETRLYKNISDSPLMLGSEFTYTGWFKVEDDYDWSSDYLPVFVLGGLPGEGINIQNVEVYLYGDNDWGQSTEYIVAAYFKIGESSDYIEVALYDQNLEDAIYVDDWNFITLRAWQNGTKVSYVVSMNNVTLIDAITVNDHDLTNWEVEFIGLGEYRPDGVDNLPTTGVKFDDVRINQYILTDEEIETLYSVYSRETTLEFVNTGVGRTQGGGTPLYEGWDARIYFTLEADDVVVDDWSTLTYTTIAWFVNDALLQFESGSAISYLEFTEGDNVTVQLTSNYNSVELIQNFSTIVEASLVPVVNGDWDGATYNHANASFSYEVGDIFRCEWDVDQSDGYSNSVLSMIVGGAQYVSSVNGSLLNDIGSYTNLASEQRLLRSFDNKYHNVTLRCAGSPRDLNTNTYQSYTGTVLLEGPYTGEALYDFENSCADSLATTSTYYGNYGLQDDINGKVTYEQNGLNGTYAANFNDGQAKYCGGGMPSTVLATYDVRHPDGQFTVSFWANFSKELPDYEWGETIFAIDYSDVGLSVNHHYVDNRTLRFVVYDGVNNPHFEYQFEENNFTDRWIHFTWTRNGSNHYLYVDGVLVNQSSYTVTYYGGQGIYFTRIGRAYSDSDTLDSASLDRLYLSTTAWSDEQILEEYNLFAGEEVLLPEFVSGQIRSIPIIDNVPLYYGYNAYFSVNSNYEDTKTYRWFVNGVENFNTFQWDFPNVGDAIYGTEYEEGDNVTAEITLTNLAGSVAVNVSTIVQTPFTSFVEGNWANQVYNESTLELYINWSQSFTCRMFADGDQIVNFQDQSRYSPDLSADLGTPYYFNIITELGGTTEDFLQYVSGNLSAYFDDAEHNISIRCYDSPRAVPSQDNRYTEYSGMVFLGNQVFVENRTVDFTSSCAQVYPNELDQPSPAQFTYYVNVTTNVAWTEEFVFDSVLNGKTENCTEINANDTDVKYSCTVPMNFYEASGNYVVDLYVNDTESDAEEADVVEFSDSVTCNYGALTAYQRTGSTLTFPGATAGSINVRSLENISVRNTGNTPLTVSTIANSLVGRSLPNVVLNANNFKMGANLTAAIALNHNNEVEIQTLQPGANSIVNFGLWLTIPQSQYMQDYYSNTAWQLIGE
jgi:hypothetical protein